MRTLLGGAARHRQRYSLGDRPVHFLKARLNALGLKKPRRSEISVTE